MRVFTFLLDLIFPPRDAESRVREADIEHLGALLRPTLVATTPPTTALLPYRAPLVRALITEMKYHNSVKARTLLGTVLAEYVSAFLAEERVFAKNTACLVPIPLGSKRRHERGYNQIEQLCEAAQTTALLPDIRIHTCLTRSRETLPQTTLRRAARLHNMEGAFVAQGPMDPNMLYLVIDDVVTTGATLSDACRALRAAGALHVFPVALSH